MTAATPRPIGTTPQVLLVEDDEAIREAIDERLREHGCVVLSAGDGAAAISGVRRARFRPDVIVLDIWMPVMDGLDFLRVRGTEPLIATAPVIVMSASPPPLTQTNMIHTTIRKPLAARDLLEAVDRACGRA